MITFLAWWIGLSVAASVLVGTWIRRAGGIEERRSAAGLLEQDWLGDAVVVWESTHCCRCSARLRDDGFERRNDGTDLCLACWMVKENHTATTAKRGGRS
jgi:hypothetical protein